METDAFLEDEENYIEYNDKPQIVIKNDHNWNTMRGKFSTEQNADGSNRACSVAPKTAYVSALIHLDGKNFDFTGRKYLEPIYNRNDPEVLLKTARQVEKSVVTTCNILLSNGFYKKAKNIEIGDELATLDTLTQKLVCGKVNWKSDIYTKPCLKITTRQGHVIEVANTHPIKIWGKWLEAGYLKVGDKIACVKKSGVFRKLANKPDTQIELIAFMIGDGYCSYKEFSFTQNPGSVLNRFVECINKEECKYRIRQRTDKKANDICFNPPVFMSELVGKNSYTHTIPEWVFELNSTQTSLFLNRLWACDGYLKFRNETSYDFVYASMSRNLILGMQALLWKFGIPSSIRENLPSIYKKRGELTKVAYLLRIETASGIKIFLEEIGALGKAESIPLPNIEKCNNNRDTYPYELSELIGEIYSTDGIGDKRGTNSKALRHDNLRKKPEYCLTLKKAKKYLSFFQNDKYDRELVQQLEYHLDSDIYWDTIKSVENIKIQECVDFSVEPYLNFVANGIITHNSTYLSNNLVINSVVNSYSKSLYVSPSHMQTRQFSSEKLKPILDDSPLIRTYFQDSSVSQQVFEKGFLNGSFIFLRSAYRTADRTRGISARNLCIFGDCLVYTQHRGIVKFKTLKQGEKVLSSDISRGKTLYSEVKNVRFTGKKDTLKIITSSGKTIITTPDHLVYSWDGWVEAQNLKLGKYLLTESPKPAIYNLISEDDALFLGLILGDGSHEKRGRIYFRNTNEALIALAKEKASNIDPFLTINPVPHNNNFTGKEIIEYWMYFPRQGKMESYLQELGILGQKNCDKYITFFHKIGINQAIQLLSGLFVTDGGICSGYNPKNKRSPYFVSASFVNTSKDLCKSVQYLLDMVGIKSQLRDKTLPKNGPSVLPQYTVAIRDIENFKIFISLIPMPTKEYQVESAKRILEQMPGCPTKTNLVPITNKELLRLLSSKLGLGTIKKFKEYSGVQIPSNNSRTQKTLAIKVAEFVGDTNLLHKLKHAGRWEEIIKIEKYKKVEVYDSAILEQHNLFVEGILAHNCLDESQDLLHDQIPVIKECTSHFIDSTILMAGTPKSLNNPLEIYWKSSSQNEWLVPCKACNKWNFLNEQNIGPTDFYQNGKIPPGPICKYCGKPIDVTAGQWVSFDKKNVMKGYRIPQLMVPWICGIYSQWLKLLWKRDHYPISQFYNEVLGLSYDSASSPISMEELVDICGTDDMWDLDNLTSEQISQARNQLLTAGVDWGEGLDGAEKTPSGKLRPASYTILSIGFYHKYDQFRFVAIKKFTGKEVDPAYVVAYITEICRILGICLVGVDWGHGWGVNNSLVRTVGANKVVQFQHLPKLKQKMKWDPLGFRYHLSRNFMMSEFFYDMKHKFIIFPKWAHFQPYSVDILSIYTEYNEFKREMKYDHRASEPDDVFHSCLYCKLASDIHLGKTRRYTQITSDTEK